MNYVVVDSMEWTYPDVYDYKSGSLKADLHTARNSYATAQIRFNGVPDKAEIKITVGGELQILHFNWYELVPVYVESNPHIRKEDSLPDYPNRWAPFYIYDCLKPLGNGITPVNGEAGLYFSANIPADIAPGVVSGYIDITIGANNVVVPVDITIYSATVPDEEHLKIIVGYFPDLTAKYHNVPLGSGKSKELDIEYLKMLRHMRQNMLYVRGVKTSVDENGKYIFDFTGMIDFVNTAISLGYKYFNAPSVGFRESWKKSNILIGPSLNAMSYEGYLYLSQYLPELRKVLIQNGWLDHFYMGVSDEPNEANATEYRALCGLVRKLAPDIKLIDAVSFGSIHGALDVWVPLNSEYDRHMSEFESYRNNNDDIWHYVCCVPRSDGYINRFMDYPLLSTRYLFWGNYKYSLGGYLHCAANAYQPGQDPFSNNCPLHRNRDSSGILPPGDTHIIYPGDDGPWMSIRLEAHRASAEDYELLRLLSLRNKDLADRICTKGFRSFKDVEYNINKFKILPQTP